MLRDLSQDSLLNLLIQLASEQRSAEIAIKSVQGAAHLSLRDGRLVHAEYQGAKGQVAFEEILRLRQGQYELLEAKESTPQTFDLEITEVLLQPFRGPAANQMPCIPIEQKTLFKFPASSSLASEGPRGTASQKSPSRNVIGRDRTKLTGTGYSSSPPPKLGEERVSRPSSSRPPAEGPVRIRSITTSTLPGGTGAQPFLPPELDLGATRLGSTQPGGVQAISSAQFGTTQLGGVQPATATPLGTTRLGGVEQAPTSLGATRLGGVQPAPAEPLGTTRLGSVQPAQLGTTRLGGVQPATAASLGTTRLGMAPLALQEEPDTGPVPSSHLDRSSLERLEELHEAISSTHHPIPKRPVSDPAEWPDVEKDAAAQQPSNEALPRVGRYEVLARLKSGGMGSIYLCRLSGGAGFQRLFAMKVLHRHLAEQPEALELFFSEARLLAQIHHPNIVGIVDVGTTEQPYLVLDYVEGGSLHELLKAASGALDAGIALSIILDALQGLSAAHQLVGEDGQTIELVHNDVTPHNLLVGVDGACRVTDFGVAKAQGFSPGSLTTRGKPSYIAPERLLRQQVDQRADIFSMGVVLYLALTGIDPFLGASTEETLRNVLERPIQPPSEVGLRPPAGFDWICMKALARNPNERFASAEEMANHLRRAASREDLLVAPGTVAHWVRTTLAATLEARRAAQRGVLSEEGRRRAATIPPGVDGASLFLSPDEKPISDAPPSSDFGEKTEILSAPPSLPKRRVRNFVIYTALVLTTAALVLVLFFPEHVQRMVRKQTRPATTEDVQLLEEAQSQKYADENPNPAEPPATQGDSTTVHLPSVVPTETQP